MKQANQKTIVKAAKLFNKSNMALPILESVKIEPDFITWNDLKVSVNIPFKTGVTGAISTRLFITALETFSEPVFSNIEKKIQISEGKQSIRVFAENIENFPVNAANNTELTQIGTLPESSISVLMDAVDFVSKDDLRPAMMNVAVKTHIAATDAHRLIFVPLESPLMAEILLPVKVVKLMDIFKGNWTVSNSKEIGRELINEDNICIQFKQTKEHFPDWPVVVPNVTDNTPVASFDNKELRKFIKTGSRFGNQVMKLAVLRLNRKAHYHTEDIDFETEFYAELNATYTDEIEIRFNWDFLDGILAKCGDSVKMNYFTPTKAAIFEGKYLLMPVINS